MGTITAPYAGCCPRVANDSSRSDPKTNCVPSEHPKRLLTWRAWCGLVEGMKTTPLYPTCTSQLVLALCFTVVCYMPPRYPPLPLMSTHALVMRFGLFFLLDKPILLNGCCAGIARRALDFWGRLLVFLKTALEICLFWGLWWLWDGELLHLALGIIGLQWSWLVGLELLQVHVLDEIGWEQVRLYIACCRDVLGSYPSGLESR